MRTIRTVCAAVLAALTTWAPAANAHVCSHVTVDDLGARMCAPNFSDAEFCADANDDEDVPVDARVCVPRP